jgi:hypothetical protein
MRRGTLQVALPLVLAGQAIAWLGYAITGTYGPWSWLKIGFAYALAGLRVPFLMTPEPRGGEVPAQEPFVMALGALTVAAVVLAFRAGREQGRGLEQRPVAASAAGATIGVGVAVPMLLIAFPVRLSFPNLGVELLRPLLWGALVVPLVVIAAIGAVGGVSVARERLERAPWGRRGVAAVGGGFATLWWALALAFVAFLVVATVETGATRAYGRAVGAWGTVGAIAVVHHALLLPNQSAMVLSIAMGSPVEVVGGGDGATVSLAGVEPVGEGVALIGEGSVVFPSWFLAFAAVPLVATIAGGRRAGEGARSPRERALVGALAGIVAALLVTLTAWAATLVLPVLAPFFEGASPTMGPDLRRTLVVALAWGLAGCTLGALTAPVLSPSGRR